MDRDTYILLRGIAIIVVLLSPFGYLYITQEEDSSQKPQSLSVKELKAQAINVSYDDLLRNTQKYKNEYIRFRGDVSQSGEGYALVRVCSDCTSPGYSNYAYLEIYKNDLIVEDKKEVKRLIDNDQIMLWARVKGRKTYKTVVGGTNTVPYLDLLYAKIL